MTPAHDPRLSDRILCRRPMPPTRRVSLAWRSRAALLCIAFCVSLPARADIEFEVIGVEEALRENIINHNDGFRLGPSEELTSAELDEVTVQAEIRAREALRPFGYYKPGIRSRHYRRAGGTPVVELKVDAGPAVLIEDIDFDVAGPGANQLELRRWKSAFPLTSGQRLNQVTWQEQKQEGLEIARAGGYLGAEYTEHRLALDLERNRADVTLHMATGDRYVMGEIAYSDHVLQPGIVEDIPRFEPGDPYSAQLMDDFRLDLWRSGYFTQVDVIAVPDPDSNPPQVDLRVELATETRSRYQGSLGYGTDTGVRVQANWSRHPMSSRGDRVDIAAGWQELNSEFAIRGTYRKPLRYRVREYWVADAKISFENQDLELKRSDEDEDFITIANGTVNQRHIKGGWLKLFNARAGQKQLSLQPFVQYLNSERRYDPIDPDSPGTPLESDPEFNDLLRGVDNTLSVGFDVGIVAIVGQGFETRGYHDQAWIFASDTSLGSDVDFLQAYFSTRRSWLRGERWKYLVRAEIGYTDAEVDDFILDAEGEPLELSVTQLPNFYRFKAGGSASVRGYNYEQLSNNNVGSNNIVTASAEIEYKLTNKWSAAVFADIGNAFNDWSDADLKLGVGVGVRWYSIAGPIRLDIAQARDFTDRPWRVHLTIGTPLL
jgi:translocation and assembly module TamA